MLIEITNKFRKQVEKLNNKRVNNSLNKVVQELSSAPNLRKINNLKKLKGHKNFYRIRMGDYRIGIAILNSDSFSGILRMLFFSLTRQIIQA